MEVRINQGWSQWYTDACLAGTAEHRVMVTCTPTSGTGVVLLSVFNVFNIVALIATFWLAFW